MFKTLLLTGKQRLEWVEAPAPALLQGYARLRTLKTAVSVSSTLSEYLGNVDVDFPRASGYESLARIEETTDPEHFPVGLRVADVYGHSDQAIRPFSRLIPVPEHIPDEVALLSILACDAFKGVYRLRPLKNSRVLVMGAGVMGLLSIWNLIQLGHEVDVFDPISERLNLAEQLGARSLHRVPYETHRFALECSGHPDAFFSMQRAMVQGGKIGVLSDGNWGRLQLTPEFHSRELTVVGSSDGVRYQDHARIFFRMPLDQQKTLVKIFDCHIKAAGLIALFESMAEGPRPLKVMVDWA